MIPRWPGIKVRKGSENTPKPNIEFSTDFKADFVGFLQNHTESAFYIVIIKLAFDIHYEQNLNIRLFCA